MIQGAQAMVSQRDEPIIAAFITQLLSGKGCCAALFITETQPGAICVSTQVLLLQPLLKRWD